MTSSTRDTPQWVIHHARFLARVLDGVGGPIQIPILGGRLGLDPILGLLTPWGDTIFLLVGAYWLWLGWHARLPKPAMAQLIMNLLMDWGIGLVPGIGDVSDFFWRAHARNADLIEAHARVNVTSAYDTNDPTQTIIDVKARPVA
jgi:hypothetical protein